MDILGFFSDILTIIYLIFLNFAYIIKTIWINCIAPRNLAYKNVKGDVVLITGAGLIYKI
jgi:hypothetical protein